MTNKNFRGTPCQIWEFWKQVQKPRFWLTSLKKSASDLDPFDIISLRLVFLFSYATFDIFFAIKLRWSLISSLFFPISHLQHHSTPISFFHGCNFFSTTKIKHFYGLQILKYVTYKKILFGQRYSMRKKGKNT